MRSSGRCRSWRNARRCAGRRAVALRRSSSPTLLAGEPLSATSQAQTPVAPSGPRGAARWSKPSSVGGAAAVDGEVGRWLVTLLDVHHGPAAVAGIVERVGRRRALARRDRRLRGLVGHAGMRWLRQLPEDPVDAVADALEVLGVADDACADELRGQCSRLSGGGLRPVV
ncbi:MAG: hypothetical protein R2699_11910 [Acidimicrobiales bacterium]